MRTGSWAKLALVAVGLAPALVLAAVASSLYRGNSGDAQARHEPVRADRSLPALPVIPVAADGVSLEAYLRVWVPPNRRDELLSSPVLGDADFSDAVHGWMEYWTGPASRWFPDFLARMAWLGPNVDSALAAHDLPPSLRYLPLIESGYAPAVTSGASAVGLWQLMAPTARGLGLAVDALLDERRDFDRSTDAALLYLRGLNDEFESWFLTLAAYNSGPTRVRRILRRHAPGAPHTDSLFWALRHHFAPETQAFVPKLFGAMWVASQPEAYGFDEPEATAVAYDEVEVPHPTTLDVVAEAAEVAHEEVVRLNPQLLRGITPPGRSVVVRVPEGGGRAFDTNYARLPAEARVSFVEHVVRSGETLSTIASRYGVRTAEVEAANPGIQPTRLRVGALITVPIAPRAAPES